MPAPAKGQLGKLYFFSRAFQTFEKLAKDFKDVRETLVKSWIIKTMKARELYN